MAGGAEVLNGATLQVQTGPANGMATQGESKLSRRHVQRPRQQRPVRGGAPPKRPVWLRTRRALELGTRHASSEGGSVSEPAGSWGALGSCGGYPSTAPARTRSAGNAAPGAPARGQDRDTGEATGRGPRWRHGGGTHGRIRTGSAPYRLRSRPQAAARARTAEADAGLVGGEAGSGPHP